MINVTSEADKVCVAKANEAGQGHIFVGWDDLSTHAQHDLIEQVKSVDFQLMKHMNHQRLQGAGERPAEHVLKPPVVESMPTRAEHPARHAECLAAGKEAIAAGKVGLVMVSGRTPISTLGDPTGFLPIGPVTGKSVFQLHAEKILAFNRRYKVSLRWWIVTHPDFHDRIVEFFKKQNHFGLNCADVIFLPQPMLPLVNRRGKFLVSEPGRLAMEHNGHGGVLLDFLREEKLEALKRAGIEHLFFFLVDNPLVQIADPVFIGRHILTESEVSSKAVTKLRAEEKVGVFCRIGGATGVVEYSELKKEDKKRTQEDGSLAFGHGNIAVHAFSVAFFERMVKERVELPFHSRPCKVSYVGKRGQRVRPTEPNCVQFIYFAFDSLRVAERATIVEVSRDEEFYPIKNSGGEHSPQTAVQGLSRLYSRWLRNAGATFQNPVEDDGLQAVEVSPLYALDEEELKAKIELPIHVDKDLCLGGRS